MSGTYQVIMGDRGRLVIPAELRARFGLAAGTPLILLGTAEGVLLTTREQAKRLVRSQLHGDSLVAELLADRRAEAAREAAS